MRQHQRGKYNVLSLVKEKETKIEFFFHNFKLYLINFIDALNEHYVSAFYTLLTQENILIRNFVI